MSPDIDECSILLYWNYKEQKWQTFEEYSYNSGNTYGKQWFLLPLGVYANNEGGFNIFFDITNGYITGDYVAGSLKYNYHGPQDVYSTGRTAFSNATVHGELLGLPLLTSSKTKTPYINYFNHAVPFIMAQPFRMARK